MMKQPLLRPEEIEIRRDTKYRAKNPLARRLLEGYFQALGGLVSSLDFSESLEVGCGEGIPMRVLSPLQGNRPAFGLDVAEEELLVAQINKGLS
jgi:hypothetical protein